MTPAMVDEWVAFCILLCAIGLVPWIPWVFFFGNDSIKRWWERRKEFTKVTIPPCFYESTRDIKKTILETQPMMGPSKAVEEAAAEQAARKLADDVEFDLSPPVTQKDALKAMFGYYDDKKTDDWNALFPEKLKKSKPKKAKPKKAKPKKPKPKKPKPKKPTKKK